jgi:hypothetical protein
VIGVVLACGLPASASGALLYDQTDSAGSSSVVSTDYDSEHDSLDSQIADDFTVPAGQSWEIDHLDVIGTIFMLSPPPKVHVFLYADSGIFPGAELFRQEGIPAANGPNYSIPISGAPLLPPGTYWVSAQQAEGNGDPIKFTDWSWTNRTVQNGDPAAFRNPGNGYMTGCIDWGSLTPCSGPDAGPDVLFKLSGTSSPFPPPTGSSTPPSNRFTFGNLRRNRKKGTAKLTVVLPGPGTLKLTGRGLVQRVVMATGTVRLLIKAKGKAQSKLSRTGTVKLKATIAFTPTGGSPSTRAKAIVLKKGVG